MPVNYDEMFGGGAMGAHFALQDRDLEREKAQGAIQQQNLANMFAEQNNPMRLQEQQMQLDGLGYDNRARAQTEQLAPLKYNAEQADFIQKIKKAELDGMQLEAQRMAYSTDPTVSAEGQRMLSMHRDFMKLREQGAQKQELEGVKVDARTERDKVLQNNRIQLKQIAPARSPSSGGGSSKPTALTTDKLAAQYTQQMEAALRSGDQASAENANAMLSRIEAYKAAQKADTGAGKTILTPEGGFGTAPPRAAPGVPVYNRNVPSQTPANKPAAPQHSLASVQQQYPGVPADKLREAYKKKFGVDLK